jgi:zinc protease
MKPIVNSRRLLSFCLLLALTASSVPSVFAQDLLPSKKDLITEYEIDNGMKFLLFPDPSSAKITVNMVVFVGSRHEGYGEGGMAHLLEHMLFKGTPKHPDIPKALRDHGAVLPTTANANTKVDRTIFFETMPATEENLEFAIKLEADRLVNSNLKAEDLASEMTVVRNEFEANENDPLTVLGQRMIAAAYHWHNYGKAVIGNQSDIERVPIDRLRAFYKKYYQPDNVLLVIAGKFDVKKALDHMAKYFAVVKRPARKLDATYTEEPAQDGERNVVLRRVGSVGAVGVMYHVPAGRHEDFPAIQVLLQILAASPNGRLYESMVTSKKANAVAGFASPLHDPGVLEIYATADAKKPIDQVRDTLLGVLEGLQSAPVTQEEVERAKRAMLIEFDAAGTSSNRMAIELADYSSQGDWELFYLHRDRVARVTPADVMRVAGRYLQQNNRTVGVYIPTEQAQRAAIPTAESAAELLKNYKGVGARPSGEALAGASDSLEKRVRRSQLPGGIKVAFFPKKTQGDLVMGQLTLRFGSERSLKDNELAAGFLSGFMLRGGTKHHSYQQVVDELDKLGSGIVLNSGLGWLSCKIVAKKDNLPQVLRLVREILREPAFAESELNLQKRQVKESLEVGRTDPASLARTAMTEKLNPYTKDDIRYTLSLDESIARLNALTADRIRKLYAEQLSGQVGEFAAVGEFDEKSTLQLLQQALADWKTQVGYEHIAMRALTNVASSRQSIRTPDKADAHYSAGLLLEMNEDHPDYNSIQVASLVFGGNSFTSRLGNRVRQKEGLSYAIESYLNTPYDEDPYALFGIEATCNPQNIDKVDAAIAGELKKLIKDGISESELAESKKLFLEQVPLLLSNDSKLLSLLASTLRTGHKLDAIHDQTKQVARLTVAEVNAAIRKHLSPDRLVIVRAGDFKATAAKKN